MSQTSETSHEKYFGSDQFTRITPPRMFEPVDVRELWAYRDLMWALALRHVQVRYRQTVLGVAWVLAQPIFQMLIFTVIFRGMASLPSDDIPYPLFAYSGLLTWNYFSSSMSSGCNSLVSNAQLITKVYFPRMLLPLASALAGLLDLVVGAVPLIALLAYYGVAPTTHVALVPVAIACLVLVVAGVGAGLGALNVIWRDIGHAIPFLLQLWFYATPVVYPRRLTPSALSFIVAWNPVTAPTELFRSAVLGRPLDLKTAGISLAVSVAVFFGGIAIFHCVERRLADVV